MKSNTLKIENLIGYSCYSFNRASQKLDDPNRTELNELNVKYIKYKLIV